MRILVTTALAATLIATNLFAAETSTAPLAPGHAAGVKKAQDADDSLWWVLGGAAAIGIIVAASSGGSSNNVSSGTQ